MGLETAAIIGIAAAGAAAVGSVGQVISNAHTNRVNSKNVADTNAMNYQIHQEDMAYQTSERLATQDYNSPANQSSRFRAAGINPYFALGSMDAGTATAQTAPSGNPMQAFHQQALPVADIVHSLTDVGMQSARGIAETDAINLDNDAKRIDLQFKTQEKLLSLSEQRARVASSSIDADLKASQLRMIDRQVDQLTTDLEILQSTKEERKAQAGLQTQLMRLDARSKELGNEFQKWSNDYQQKYGAQQLKSLVASIKETYSRVSLNSSLSAKAIADKMLSDASRKGVKLDNHQKTMLNPILVDIAEEDKKIKQYQSRHPSRFEQEVQSPMFRVLDRILGNSRDNGFGYVGYE